MKDSRSSWMILGSKVQNANLATSTCISKRMKLVLSKWCKIWLVKMPIQFLLCGLNSLKCKIKTRILILQWLSQVPKNTSKPIFPSLISEFVKKVPQFCQPYWKISTVVKMWFKEVASGKFSRLYSSKKQIILKSLKLRTLNTCRPILSEFGLRSMILANRSKLQEDSKRLRVSADLISKCWVIRGLILSPKWQVEQQKSLDKRAEICQI